MPVLEHRCPQCGISKWTATEEELIDWAEVEMLREFAKDEDVRELAKDARRYRVIFVYCGNCGAVISASVVLYQ
jgi:uncharacterized Zn finger protein